MTTVIVDAKEKVIYADSRMTCSINSLGKTWYEKGNKTFYHKSGKLLAAVSGNFNIAIPKLASLGFKLKPSQTLSGRKEATSSKDTSTILVLGSDTENIVHIYNTVEEDSLEVKWKTKILEGYNRAWTGSGIDTGIVDKLFRYNNNFDPVKIIKACSLVDEGTDDDVQVKRLIL